MLSLLSSLRSTLRGLAAGRGPLLAALALGALPVAAVGLDSLTKLTSLAPAPMLLSGESIGSLPCYVTPADQAPIPGATDAENALQEQPSLRVEVPYADLDDTVLKADGEGYAFLAAGATDADVARVLMFGDTAATIDVTELAGRERHMSWHVGPAFQGADLFFVMNGQTLSLTLPPGTEKILLPVESSMWTPAFESGSVLLVLVRPDGEWAALEVDREGDEVTAVTNVP